MKIEQAKAVLQSYRPNTSDADDPAFKEALDLMAGEPELREWFSRQQVFDASLSNDFSTIQPPSELRNRILNAAKKVDRKTSSDGSATGSSTKRASQHAAWLSFLGLGVGIAAGLIFWIQRPAPIVGSKLAQFAIGDAQDGAKHTNHSPKAADLRKKMNESATRLQDLLPIDFHELHESGCRTVKVEGRDVVEFCFKRNGSGHHWYIARRIDFPKVMASKAPEITKHDTASIATWSDDLHLYVLVTKPEPQAFEKMM